MFKAYITVLGALYLVCYAADAAKYTRDAVKKMERKNENV